MAGMFGQSAVLLADWPLKHSADHCHMGILVAVFVDKLVVALKWPNKCCMCWKSRDILKTLSSLYRHTKQISQLTSLCSRFEKISSFKITWSFEICGKMNVSILYWKSPRWKPWFRKWYFKKLTTILQTIWPIIILG